MGGCASKPKTRFFHFFDKNFNELTIFDCNYHEFESAHFQARKTPHQPQSISTNDGLIYCFGGMTTSADDKPVPSDEYFILDSQLIQTTQPEPSNDAKAFTLRKLITKSGKLPEARTGHLLIADPQYIYILGGEINGKKTKTSQKKLRFCLNSEQIERIADFPVEFHHPCGISLHQGDLYIFDTAHDNEAKLPRIFQYEHRTKLWKDLSYDTVSGAPLMNAHHSAFLVEPNMLLVIGAENKKERAYYFDLDIKKMWDADFKQDRVREYVSHHRAGNTVYCNEGVVFDISGSNLIEYDWNTKTVTQTAIFDNQGLPKSQLREKGTCCGR